MTPESKAGIDAAVSYDYISRQGQLGDGSNVSSRYRSEEKAQANLVTKNGEAVYRRYEDSIGYDGEMVDDNGANSVFDYGYE